MSNSRPLGALLSPCMRAGRCIGCSSKCDCTIDAERCASASQTQPGSVRGDTAHAAHTQHFAGCWEEGGVGRDLNLAFLAVSRCSLPSWCCSSMLVAASTSGVHPPSTARRHTRVPRHAHACQYHSTRERAPTLAALPHLGLAVFDLPPVRNRWRLLRGLLPDEPVKPSGVLVLLPRRLLPCPRTRVSASACTRGQRLSRPALWRGGRAARGGRAGGRRSAPGPAGERASRQGHACAAPQHARGARPHIRTVAAAALCVAHGQRRDDAARRLPPCVLLETFVCAALEA